MVLIFVQNFTTWKKLRCDFLTMYAYICVCFLSTGPYTYCTGCLSSGDRHCLYEWSATVPTHMYAYDLRYQQRRNDSGGAFLGVIIVKARWHTMMSYNGRKWLGTEIIHTCSTHTHCLHVYTPIYSGVGDKAMSHVRKLCLYRKDHEKNVCEDHYRERHYLPERTGMKWTHAFPTPSI